MDKLGSVDGVFLDFAKAFDKKSHPRLFSKLDYIRNSVIMTVMIRFSAFLPRSTPPPPPSSVFLLISAPRRLHSHKRPSFIKRP